MGRFAFLAPTVLVGLVAVIYFATANDVAGASMLAFFAVGAGFFSWILIPTFSNEGPTAPIDPDFEDPGR
jgi:hypothetical protein